MACRKWSKGWKSAMAYARRKHPGWALRRRKAYAATIVRRKRR